MGRPPVSNWGVYFAVQGVEDTVGRVKTGGGAGRVEPFDIGIGKVAVLGDPQGATFSILHNTASC